MKLTDKAKEDFLKWYKERYSYLSQEKFETNDDFEKHLERNEILINSLIIMWFDSFRNIGNEKTIQHLIKKCLKDYECAMTWFEMQIYVIEKANKIYNAKFS